MITACEFGADVVAYTSNFVKDSAGEFVEVFDTVTYSADEFSFTIDQLSKQIYLRDSLPYGSNVEKMPLSIQSAAAYGMLLVDDGEGGEEEVAWTYADSLDLTSPIRLKVYASDEVTTCIYTITVPVHQVDPDTLVWSKVADSFSYSKATGVTRTVVIGDEIATFAETSSGVSVFKNSWSNMSSAWNEYDLSTILSDAKLGSAQVFGGRLYMVTDAGSLLVSDDAVTWEATTLDGQIEMLVGAITTNGTQKLVAIVDDNGVKTFRLTADCSSWESDSGEVPSAFPVDNFSGFERKLATNSTQYRLCVIGTEDSATALNDTTTFAWYSLDGVSWTEMEGASTLRLPKLTLPTMLYYADETIAFGSGDSEQLSTLYTSEDYGLVWWESTYDMRLDYSFEGRVYYSAAVDGDDWIWIFFSSDGDYSDEVWKGRVNRLGFAD